MALIKKPISSGQAQSLSVSKVDGSYVIINGNLKKPVKVANTSSQGLLSALNEYAGQSKSNKSTAKG